jgi:GTPase SAR1 family protein
MKSLIDPQLLQITSNLADAIKKLERLTDKVAHAEMQETVTNILMQLEAPFTFVIVGEVKAGKSSFINALLESEKDICKVAVSPMTDTIQQIVYGEEENVVYINDYIKKISAPFEILKEIAIVDTPGTNTIVDHHQEITEKFIPYSDLIVFVFEAKNPYRQSAWNFFDYINKEWQRKIIFVLQQKDLMNEEDLIVNIQGVVENALKKGIAKPNVFAVSAKLEKEGDKETSGFIPLRKYIADNITNGKAPYLKMANTINTAMRINETIAKSVQLREKQYELDIEFRKEISDTLAHQESKTKNQVAQLVENLLATYDKITAKKFEELEDGLGFITVFKRAFSSIFGKESGLKEWLDNHAKDFELQLNTSLKDKLQAGILDVADNIQMMGKLVDSKIKNSTTVLTNSDEIFADIAERRITVLKDLQTSFNQFMSKSENFYDETLIKESSKMAPNLAAGGGIAIIGTILAAVANGAIFDVTGGVLAAVGVTFAGVTLGLNRRKILQTYNSEIIKGRQMMEVDVADKLNDYTSKIKNRINDNFETFDALLRNEKTALEEMNDLHKEIITTLVQNQEKVNTFIS